MFQTLRRLLQRKTVQFQPEDALEETMLRAYQDENRLVDFFRTLGYADLYVPQPGPAPKQELIVVVAEESRVEVPLIQREGRTYVPVFSSVQQMTRFVPEGAAYLRNKCRDLVAHWNNQHWMLLNPGGLVGRELSPTEIAALPESVARVDSKSYPAGTKVIVGSPATEPVRLLKALSQFCEAEPAIVSAYHAQTHWLLPSEVPHITIGF